MTVDDTARYLELVWQRPRPTEAQMAAFARFIAGDHSWYKHLPLRGAGEPFLLYLSPNVHAVLVDNATAGKCWRPVVRQLPEDRPFYDWRVALEPGDVDPNIVGPMHYLFSNKGTAEYREELGYWSYWNHGPPDQPREDAIAQAATAVYVLDDQGCRVPVPTEVLKRGLVYLRATISGFLGPTETAYEELQAAEGLPDPHEDQADQLEELVAAMQNVTDWVFDGG